ncbi:MAG: hypothetical protein IJS88_01330 [Alphaproteobacteria bacterium]|nr:hypothetical protein [Alphaproteobacteria bacterium]
MKNKYVYVLFFLPIAVLAAVMGYYINAIRFERVEIVVSGYDPKDFFSGYYMELQPNWSETDCTQFADAKCPTNAFKNRYKFYIKNEQSAQLTKAVNAGIVKLVFSYRQGYTPHIVDLLADNKSYIEYLEADK